MLESTGGRKLIGGLVVTAVGVIVTFLKGDVPANLQQLLEVVFGAFVLGNAAEHGAMVMKGKAELSLAQLQQPVVAPPQQDLTHIENGISLVQQLLELIIKRTGIDKMPEKP
jgi:hypothetical protein